MNKGSFTKEQADAHNKKHPVSGAVINRAEIHHAQGAGLRTHSRQEKPALPAAGRRRDDGQEIPRPASADCKFAVHVTLRISDNRRRDADNGATTLIDCIIAARRRLESCSHNHHHGDKGAEG